MSKVVLIHLLEMIPDVTYCDKDKCNILHKMIEESEISMIKKFLNIATAKGQLEEIINLKNNEGMTPLHLAVELDRQDVANLLVEFGADTNIENIDGKIVKWIPEMSGGGKPIKVTGIRKL